MKRLFFLFLSVFVFSATIFAQSEIRTPPPASAPRINGASVIGVTTGNPLFYKIPVSGEKPIRLTTDALPKGIILNANGVLEGCLSEPGDYPISVTAENRAGKTGRTVIIRAGSQICLTPPLAWNSWYNFSEAVSDKKIRAVADAFVRSGLSDYGWAYINIDDCWQGERMERPPFALLPNEKFPDMEALCEYLHERGLKIGLYHSPWIGTYAGFRGGSSDSETGSDDEAALLPENRLQPGQIFGRYPGVHVRGADRIGKHWFFDADLKLFAEWGIDYLKVDWHPNDIPTAARMHRDVRASGRDIVLSFSNKAFRKDIPELSEYAELWRTSGDITDSWSSLSRIARDLPNWFPFVQSGKYNDPDMLQVGNLATPNRPNETFRKTRLSPEEQYYQISLWVIAAAPLILSCDIASLNDFTKNLLTNTEVLAVHQSFPVNPPQLCKKKGSVRMISRETENGTAVCILNDSGIKKTVIVSFADLNLFPSEKTTVRDLWRQTDLPPHQMNGNGFTVETAAHSGELLLIYDK